MTKIALIYCSLAFLVTACADRNSLFKELPASRSGITFNNRIEEDGEDNVYRFMNIYTGAGVAVGDINNDGLMDLYFSGNMTSGRLYVNRGDLKFEDITGSSGIENQRWGTGAVMVDINQDGFQDIYVAVSGNETPKNRQNLLYVNNGDMTFSERGKEYGIADQRQTQHAAFFDYDLDGDLDLFLIINPAAYEQKVNVIQPRKVNGEGLSNDVLYRNNGDKTFTDVSHEAGILIEGYSLGVGISDINGDQWPDIYVSNDFVGNDILYINQGDGTFEDRAGEYLNHTSYAGMGNDLADFNNDGLVDIMVLDMRPEDNLRQKLIISSSSYDRFQLMLETGYQPQYSRNTLQLNRGGSNFSEIGFLAGVSSTDWSWSALFADYDNDGDKDLFVTNGFMRDLGDLDYIHYQNIYDNPMGDPQVKIENKLNDIKNLKGADLQDYLFENTGNVQFQNRSREWGIRKKGYSNGAVYVDLDNDGDLELVVNNINQAAHVYENRSDRFEAANYLKLHLKGPELNKNGIGVKVRLTTDGDIQFYENFLSRGYESSVDPRPHFGMAEHQIVDTLEIYWPDGGYQMLTQIPVNQTLVIDYRQATASTSKALVDDPYFEERTAHYGVDYQHRENHQIDFNLQPILPKMHAQEGPGVAVSDVNGDDLEDFFVGGAAGSPGTLFIRARENNGFITQSLNFDSAYEDLGALFFDVEGDGDQDLYVVSGGTSHGAESSYYQDRLYLNDGLGNFKGWNHLPTVTSSGSIVVGSDFDRDGDIDLFVGGRIIPGQYPLPPRSYLLRNDSKNYKPRFTDITSEVPGLDSVGMVTSALWTDYNNDQWPDLMVSGEFMPILIFGNHQGKLQKDEIDGLEHSRGWWNSLLAADVDNDGDMDYLGGNLGLNSRYRASTDQPLCVYASDFDKNGRIDPVMCQYIDGENYLTHTRDDLIKQINAMRARFKTYREYAEATFDQSFLKQELDEAYILKAERFESSYLQNNNGSGFTLKALPWSAQLSPIYGMAAEDINLDGNLDLIVVGNSYSSEVSTGRYDASYGLVLMGNGQGSWQPLEPRVSGFLNKGDAKGLTRSSTDQGTNFIVTNNNGPLRIYFLEDPSRKISLKGDEWQVIVELEDGRKRKEEIFYGNSYLGQSTRSVTLNPRVKQVTIMDYQENIRTLGN